MAGLGLTAEPLKITPEAASEEGEIDVFWSFDKSVCDPGAIGPRVVIVQKVNEWRTHSFLFCFETWSRHRHCRR